MDIGEDYSHLYAHTQKKHKRKVHTDGVRVKKIRKTERDLVSLYSETHNNYHDNVNALLLGGERTCFFVTEDSRRYISTQQERQLNFCNHYLDVRSKFDSVHVRYHKDQIASEVQYALMRTRVQNTYEVFAQYRASLQFDFSPNRMWQVSLTGAMIFGMVSMSLIYSNFGQSVFAKDDVAVSQTEKNVVRVIENTTTDTQINEKTSEDKQEEVFLNEGNVKDVAQENVMTDTLVQTNVQDEKVTEPVIVTDIVTKNDPKKDVSVVKQEKQEDQREKIAIDSAVKKDVDELSDSSVQEKSFEEIAYETVEGYPIEKMLPYILKQDPEVAKYLIAIAKQESAWGKRVPVLNGQDCYNYWGYRGIRKLMGTGGHTCFNSRQDAVETVGKRLHDLIYEYDRTTANKLVVWKCGSSCATHSPESVDRWIGVVDTYYDALSQK